MAGSICSSSPLGKTRPSSSSYGWTHNQDIRLVFPTDPIGKAGYVLFKDQSGNMYAKMMNILGVYIKNLAPANAAAAQPKK